MSQQTPPNNNPLAFFVTFLSSLLELIINKDTGRVAVDRVIACLLIATLWGGYVNRTEIFSSVSDSNKTAAVKIYKEAQEQGRLEKLGQEIRTNSQHLLALFNPDIAGVWIYKPQDKHYFMEMVYYEGTLPENTTIKDYSNIGVDRSTKEYSEHSNSIPYISNGLEDTLASITNTGYFVYSCPLYNKYGYYQGKVAMYWKDVPNPTLERRYYTECAKSARQISQYLDTNNELIDLFSK